MDNNKNIELLSVMMRNNSNIKPIKVGENLYQTYCPFCKNDAPTLLIERELQEYHCFSCKRIGNVTNFIMENYNTDFMGAVKILTGKEASSEEFRKSLEEYYEMNKKAAIFYNKALYSKEGKKGLNYWKDVRGLSDDTIRKFGLGYTGFSDITKYLKNNGYTDSSIIKNALARKKDGKVYDFYYNRVMIPIIDINKKVIGFGGRVLDDSKPKYLNSGATPVFDKRLNLYALNLAQYSQRDGLILCEGYLDVIAMHQAGIDNAVASLGTALTEEQVYLMSRFTNTVYIAYDMDEAGCNATENAKALLKAQNMCVKRINMIGAKDPDEFIKKFGVAELYKRIIFANEV